MKPSALYTLSLAFMLSLAIAATADNNDEVCTCMSTAGFRPTGSELFFIYNGCTNEAVLIRRTDPKRPYYQNDPLVVPLTMTAKCGSMGFGGSSPLQSVSINVTEIGEEAFVDATSSSVSFETPTNVRVIRRAAMSRMNNITGTLELPEGITLLETEALYTGFTTLIIPSSMDSLALSSVLLEKAEAIIFLGTTPPRCATEGGFTPWNKDGAATPRDVTITIPDGSFETYKATAGIGDYFTFFDPANGITTSLQEEVSPRNRGIYSITGVYLGEDSSNLPRGIYIINGKKVVR